MIQRGTKILALTLSFILSCPGFICGNEKTAAKESVFSHVGKVSVLSLVGFSKLSDKKIQATIEKDLSSIGTVTQDSSDNFGQGLGVLTITIAPIAEENAAGNVSKKLPVISISMQLAAGAQLMSNNSSLVIGLIWEKEKFISNDNQKELSDRIEKTVQLMLNELKEKYLAAGVKPLFFLNNI